MRELHDLLTRLAVGYEEYKKQHPGTRKTRNDPMFFHGSPHAFSKFDDKHTQGVDYGKGHYFTGSKDEAREYAVKHDEPGYVHHVELDIKKPYDVRSKQHASAVAKKLGLSMKDVEANEDWKNPDTGQTEDDKDNYFHKLTGALAAKKGGVHYHEAKQHVQDAIKSLNHDGIHDPKRNWMVAFKGDQVKTKKREKAKPYSKKELDERHRKMMEQFK